MNEHSVNGYFLFSDTFVELDCCDMGGLRCDGARLCCVAGALCCDTARLCCDAGDLCCDTTVTLCYGSVML